MRNVILIGYRCTGKSTAGKKLAERLGCPFFDTDDLITKRKGKTIVEIVSEGGWELFRREEREIIQRLSDEKNAVIAAGGGTLEKKERPSIGRSPNTLSIPRRERSMRSSMKFTVSSLRKGADMAGNSIG
ncbi:MAG: hypothetical protein JRC86_10775, partial [Deltaproteobacteria bacterium]|nr:hypothetical protein [Deltaproteobacteria bacterium]